MESRDIPVIGEWDIPNKKNMIIVFSGSLKKYRIIFNVYRLIQKPLFDIST